MDPALRRLKLGIDAAGGLACLALLAAFLFGALFPLLHRREDVGARRRDLAAQRQRVASAQSSAQSLRKQLAAAEGELSRTPVHLEDARRINHRLAMLNELAAAHGLEIDGVLPGAMVRGARYQTIALKLNGTGTYRGCVEFLHELHEALPDTAVQAFTLSGNTQEKQTRADFDFELRWYAAPARPPSGVTAAAAAAD